MLCQAERHYWEVMLPEFRRKLRKNSQVFIKFFGPEKEHSPGGQQYLEGGKNRWDIPKGNTCYVSKVSLEPHVYFKDEYGKDLLIYKSDKKSTYQSYVWAFKDQVYPYDYPRELIKITQKQKPISFHHTSTSPYRYYDLILTGAI